MILKSVKQWTDVYKRQLYEIVSQDIPVVVWVTISMTDRGETEGWYTRSGEYVDWSTYDHGAVLIGYTQDTVTIADPVSYTHLDVYKRQVQVHIWL